MPYNLSRRYNPPVLSCAGGFGNALISVFTAGKIKQEISAVNWQPQHTTHQNSLSEFISVPITTATNNLYRVRNLFNLENLQKLVQHATKYETGVFSYIDVGRIKEIEQDHNICAVHIRLGDFKLYGNAYYIPDADYIKQAIKYLPSCVDTLKIVTNGTPGEVANIIDKSGCGDLYNLIYCGNDETRPDLVLVDMLSCGSIIRTGSTLSLSAVIMKKFDTIVYSVNSTSPYGTEKVKIDLPGAHAIIVS